MGATFGTEEMTQMAQYVAELVRQGVDFEVKRNGGTWEVRTTGGF